MRSEHRLRFLVLATLLTAGCPSTDAAQGLSTTSTAQLYDYNSFVCDAMPVLIRHCSYLACHGNPAHAFRVYSPGKLREGDVASRSDRDASLTESELQGNFDSAAGVLLAARPVTNGTLDLQTAPLLLKPLKAKFGGSEHHGVGVFPFAPAQTLETDAEWTALVAWVSGAKQPSPPTADCQALFSAIGATPK